MTDVKAEMSEFLSAKRRVFPLLQDLVSKPYLLWSWLSGKKKVISVVFDAPVDFHYFHEHPVVVELAKNPRFSVFVIMWEGFSETRVPDVTYLPVDGRCIRALFPFDIRVATGVSSGPWWLRSTTEAMHLHGVGPKVTYFAVPGVGRYQALLSTSPYVEEKQRPFMNERAMSIPVGLPALDGMIQEKNASRPSIGRFEQDRPLALYAPSWSSQGDQLSICDEMLEALAAQDVCNVVIRPHPNLMNPRTEGERPWRDALLGLEAAHEHVRIHHGPNTSIYDVLSFADALISDFSSVLYEYLVFDRPILLTAKRPIFESYGGADVYQDTANACWILDSPLELPHLLAECLDCPEAKNTQRATLMARMLFNPGKATQAMVGALSTLADQL